VIVTTTIGKAADGQHVWRRLPSIRGYARLSAGEQARIAGTIPHLSLCWVGAGAGPFALANVMVGALLLKQHQQIGNDDVRSARGLIGATAAWAIGWFTAR